MLRDEKRQPGETLRREDSSARDRIKAASENAPACRARKLEVLEARESLRRVDEREMRSALPEVMERLLGVAARGRCAGDLGAFAADALGESVGIGTGLLQLKAAAGNGAGSRVFRLTPV